MDIISEGHIMKLLLQSLLILVFGLFLWKIMTSVSRKFKHPKKNSFFENSFKDKWKRK